MTVEQWLRQAERRLDLGPHPDRARPDSELLMRRALGWDRARLVAHSNDQLPEEDAASFCALLDRRVTGEPIQYIMGEAEFYGLPFCVTPDVLIPRPETEHLVERAIELAAQFVSPRIIDVGTGSGAIAVALARELPSARITAVDLSESALGTAKTNAKRNGADDRIRFLQGDLLAPAERERFDMVVSNPPYVASAERETLAIEVREHEPPVALFAGADGLAVYRRLIPAAHAALVPGGYLLLEIGYGQFEAVRDLLDSAGFDAMAFVADLQHIPRVAVARRP